MARDGQAEAAIALPAGQVTGDDRAAAAELQTYLERSTGAKLAIVSEAEAKAPALLIGLTGPARRLGLPEPSLRTGGFLIRTVPEGVVLAGTGPMAARFATYYLLEQFVLLPNLTTDLKQQAALIVDLADGQSKLWTDTATAQTFVDRAGTRVTARLMLLDQRGNLLASSDVADADLVDVLSAGGVAAATGGGADRFRAA